MNVLSLFDGISGAMQALKNLNVDCDYYALEIDKYAISISNNNHPEIIHLGDVEHLNPCKLPRKIDLLIGGSPCQDLSIAKKDRKGLLGPKSSLFWYYHEFVRLYKPKYFIFENVASMSKYDKDIISMHLGVEPIMIDSALLTAQSRKRLYWCNFHVLQPYDKYVYLKDILEYGYTDKNKSYCLDANYYKGGNLKSYFNKKRRQLIFDKPVRIGDIGGESQAQRVYRKLTPVECERLQGYPDGYTEGVSNTQRYKCLGNSFTIPVIEHLIEEAIKDEELRRVCMECGSAYLEEV